MVMQVMVPGALSSRLPFHDNDSSVANFSLKIISALLSFINWNQNLIIG